MKPEPTWIGNIYQWQALDNAGMREGTTLKGLDQESQKNVKNEGFFYCYRIADLTDKF